ncbi:hypothetical protein [Amycolatopsis aidingensis]|uniref:hypothetical protein n=1 Tax=Amycolatopsis aidingensis TaxID=2842453 RepID=UPI001C0E623C|nr:hypothetical protein [Amycolatopsis aidingensis]
MISSRIAVETNSAAGLPDTDEVRALSWLVWRDIEHWFVGGEPVKEGEVPRYAVRITLAEGATTAQQRASLVRRVLEVLAEIHDNDDRLTGPPHAWVQFAQTPRDEQCLSS